jgi:hypothetical protein
MKLMRSNHHDDPLNQDDACNAISARCDLNPTDSSVYDCFGAHDAKVTTYTGKSDLSFFGVLSPTFDDERPFSWSDQNQSLDSCRPDNHVGHPNTFNFSWYSFPDAFETQSVTSAVASLGSNMALRGGAMVFGRSPLKAPATEFAFVGVCIAMAAVFVWLVSQGTAFCHRLVYKSNGVGEAFHYVSIGE